MRKAKGHTLDEGVKQFWIALKAYVEEHPEVLDVYKSDKQDK